MRAVIIGLVGFALLTAGGTVFLVKRLLDTPTVIADEVDEEVAPVFNVFVLVADNDLPAGKTISRSDLRWQPWPEDAAAGKFITSSTEDKDLIKDFTGSVVRRGILEGTPFMDAMVFRRDEPGFLAGALSPGMRAVAISVTEVSGAAGFILPGDYVDIILTHDIRTDYRAPTGGENISPVIAESIVRYTSETIVRNAHVVAIDQSFDDLEGEATVVETVTVEVTSKQVEAIATAKAMGDISLSLRSLADDDAQDTKGEFTSDIEISPTLAKAFGNPEKKRELTPKRAAGSTSSAYKVKVNRGSTSTSQVFKR